MQKTLLAFVVLLFSFAGSAETVQKPKRDPAQDAPTVSGIKVQLINSKAFKGSEVWVDTRNNVVCYVLNENTSNSTNGGLFCVKVDSASVP